MGYRNLHGLDPSSGMLKEAKKKNVFTKLICDYMGPNKLDIDNGNLIIQTAIFLFYLENQKGYYDEH